MSSMDAINEAADKLQTSYANLKKLSQEKRVQQILKSYDNQRQEIWNSIMEHHEIIMKSGVPSGYEAEFKKLNEVNKKYKDKLSEFGLLPDNHGSSEMQKQKSEMQEMIKKMFESCLATQTSYMQNLQEQINSMKQSQRPEQNTSTAHSAETMKSPADAKHVDTSAEPEITVKLMQLLARQSYQDLPSFSGSYEDWPTFINYFNSTKNAFSDIENHGRLLKCLHGEAKNSVKSLLINPHNVQAVIEMLEFQYGQPDTLIRTLMSKVRNIKPITDHEWKQQINLATEVKNLCSTIENSGAVSHLTNPLLIDEIISKLSSNKQVAWHRWRINSNKPSFNIKDLSEWLLNEAKPLTCLLDAQIGNVPQQTSNSSSKRTSTEKNQSNISRVHLTQDVKAKQCFLCKSTDHTTLDCVTFTASKDKVGLMKFYKLCVFCGKHRYNRQFPCKSRDYLNCEKCNGKHITVLHTERSPVVTSRDLPVSPSSEPTISSNPVNNSELNSNDTNINTLVTHQKANEYSLMPTVIANIVLNKDQTIPVRCLVDQCAERSYISERLAKVLGLERHKTNEIIKGINNVTTFASHYIKVCIKFNDNSLANLNVSALILPQITGKIPRNKVPTNIINFNLQLADPGFGEPGNIEMLLGNDVAFKIFKNNEPIKVSEDGLIYQATHFGWIISGNTNPNVKGSKYVASFVTLSECNQKLNSDIELSQKLTEFYSLPETIEENEDANIYCEELFKSKHYRMPNGRYVVPVPWIPNAAELGSSYSSARSCFLSQERRWQNNPIHLEKSIQFMKEYFEMGHMQPIEEHYHRDLSNHVCYIPYISILREDSYTTKLRNVFNASAKTSNGVSLNDTMYEGKKLQTKIFHIIVRSRSFKYIYSADITKMFRQIMILPSDGQKMRIIWRSSPLVPLNEFQLNTVTYGTDAAPWQAIRTIHQCADDNSPSNAITEIIKNSFYVDDLLHGGNTIEECQEQIDGIIKTMNAGCFPLRKWMANNNNILQNIPQAHQISSYLNTDSEPIKILGLIYERESDQYVLNIKHIENITYTKRGIASAAASFYDPSGFILPFIMKLRIFLRNIWAEKVEWDDTLNDNICKHFDKCLENVSILRSIKIPRWIGSEPSSTLELIGFSDASLDGLAAIIYSRVKISNNYIITIMAAKGKVTKLRTPKVLESRQQTIPKLELEAILILVTLYEEIKNCLHQPKIEFTAYTDSQIALSWVRNNTVSQKFIRRKVEKINKFIIPQQINYVNTKENPADVASRGLTPEQLANCKLFYNGPDWLQNHELPRSPMNDPTNSNCLTTLKDNEIKEDMFLKFSSFMFLIRVVALIFRWKRYKKSVSCYERYKNPKDGKLYFRFCKDEITYAKRGIIKYYQDLYLNSIIINLKSKVQIPGSCGKIGYLQCLY